MPKGPDGAILDAVSVNRGSAILLHRQIYDGLRKLVLSGPPSSNARLTSMRTLTRELEVS
jgi:DNA-binding GntR family transcriptional regulator